MQLVLQVELETRVSTGTGAGDTGVQTGSGARDTGATGIAGPVTGGFCFFYDNRLLVKAFDIIWLVFYIVIADVELVLDQVGMLGLVLEFEDQQVSVDQLVQGVLHH